MEFQTIIEVICVVLGLCALSYIIYFGSVAVKAETVKAEKVCGHLGMEFVSMNVQNGIVSCRNVTFVAKNVVVVN